MKSDENMLVSEWENKQQTRFVCRLYTNTIILLATVGLLP